MRVSYLENQLSGNKIEAVFAFRQDQFKLYFESKDISLHASNEAFICCALLPAMASGCAQIDFEGTLSEQFSSNLVLIQALFSKWQKHLKPVNIKPSLSQKKLSHDKVNKKKRVASFFSGGVDSFYTLLKHHEEITDIILVHGFDMPLWNTTLREKTSAKVKQVATHYGKNVIEVETNLRELLDPHEDWLMAHGTALACIGHLLSANFKKIYIPSSYSHEQLVPLGTHPDLDPLWSSEALTFVHDGIEYARPEKIEWIGKNTIFLRNLRVCWLNPNNAYNCGRCLKCLRNMMILKSLGNLEACTTFDVALDTANIKKIEVTDYAVRKLFQDDLKFIKKKSPTDLALINALQHVINKPVVLMKIKHRLKYTLQKYWHWA